MGTERKEHIVYDEPSGTLVIRGELGRKVWHLLGESVDGNGDPVESDYHLEYSATVLGEVAIAAGLQNPQHVTTGAGSSLDDTTRSEAA